MTGHILPQEDGWCFSRDSFRRGNSFLKSLGIKFLEPTFGVLMLMPTLYYRPTCGSGA
jgi:hypothetical protein